MIKSEDPAQTEAGSDPKGEEPAQTEFRSDPKVRPPLYSKEKPI